MAKATAGPLRTPRTVTLRITEGEADFLVGALAQVGGHNTKSPRKYANRIRHALEGALGYGFEKTDSHKLSIGFIFCRPYGSEAPTLSDRLALFALLAREGFIWHREMTAKDVLSR